MGPSSHPCLVRRILAGFSGAGVDGRGQQRAGRPGLLEPRSAGAAHRLDRRRSGAPQQTARHPRPARESRALFLPGVGRNDPGSEAAGHRVRVRCPADRSCRGADDGLGPSIKRWRRPRPADARHERSWMARQGLGRGDEARPRTLAEQPGTPIRHHGAHGLRPRSRPGPSVSTRLVHVQRSTCRVPRLRGRRGSSRRDHHSAPGHRRWRQGARLRRGHPDRLGGDRPRRALCVPLPGHGGGAGPPGRATCRPRAEGRERPHLRLRRAGPVCFPGVPGRQRGLRRVDVPRRRDRSGLRRIHRHVGQPVSVPRRRRPERRRSPPARPGSRRGVDAGAAVPRHHRRPL